MKPVITILFVLFSYYTFSQIFNVTKTEVSFDLKEFKIVGKNTFIKSIELTNIGVEIVLANNERVSFLNNKIDVTEDNSGFMKIKDFFDLEITGGDGGLLFAYSTINEWDKNDPNKLLFFRVWFVEN